MENTEEMAHATRESIDWEATAELWKERALALRQQLEAAEAVIEMALTFDGRQTVDGVTDRGYLSPDEWRDEKVTTILSTAPLTVLAAHDAEVRDAASKEALREAAQVAARAWREGAVAILRTNGVESVDRYLENLAESGHANPYLAEGGA